ncbi:hypothetical protein [Actinoplanes sp. NPDC049802]|uniref:hypothetical protein n=1 Tax=Actinoplanes sp. NPDC049802 TaxID=3154742 RepID=UPI0033CB6374
MAGVDVFWRRVSDDGFVAPGSMAEVRALAPHFTENGYREAVEAGLLVGTEDFGEMVPALVQLAAPDHPAAGLLWPSTWDEELMTSMVGADDVREISDLLVDSPFEEWAERFRVALAAEFYLPELSDDVVEMVARDAREVTELFAAAAADGDAIFVRVVA